MGPKGARTGATTATSTHTLAKYFRTRAGFSRRVRSTPTTRSKFGPACMCLLAAMELERPSPPQISA
eukprot:11909824-Alexandrium_andersonii.AAC.1